MSPAEYEAPSKGPRDVQGPRAFSRQFGPRLAYHALWEGGRADEGDGLENGLRVAFGAAMRRPRRCAVCAASAGFLETAHQGASRVNEGCRALHGKSKRPLNLMQPAE